jgi:hypothetical protein
MEDILLGFLGPYTKPLMGLTFFSVVLARKSIGKRHIVFLLIVTVLASIAFFALLLWSFTWYTGQKSLPILHFALKILAALVVCSGTAIGFSFILKSLGLATLDGTEVRSKRRQVR